MTINLDRWLAENLMKWIEGTDFTAEIYGPKNQCERIWILSPDPPLSKELWQPTKNFTQSLGDGQAGSIVGKMREMGFYMKMRFNPLTEKYSVSFWKRAGGRAGASFNTIPAMAICQAARAAIGRK